MRYLAAALLCARALAAAVVGDTSLAPASANLAAQAPGIRMPPQTLYVFGINSPVIQLSPTALGPAAATWNMTYSNISSAAFAPGMIGLGQAAYTTTLAGTAGATVSFQFVGTGVSLLGSAGFFDVLDWRVDGIAHNPTGSAGENQNAGFGWEAEVAWARDLAWGLHQCTLVVQTTYERVVLMEVMVLTGIEGATLTDSPTDTIRQITPAVDGTGSANAALNATGKWAVHTPDEGDILTRAAFPESGYTVLRTNTSGATLRYTLPPRTAYVEVWGSTGWQFANYTVTLTPPPPFNPPVLTYVANTAFYVPAYILSWAILDPKVDYVLEFKAVSGGWSEVWNVQYFVANETSAADVGRAGGVPLAAVAGGIAGAFVAGLALAALIGLALFRVYRNKHENHPVFEVDNGHDARPQPFYAPPASQAPEMQGYGDGVLGLGAANASRASLPVSPVPDSSTGDTSHRSSSSRTHTMHAVNGDTPPAPWKPSREPVRRGTAPAPLPLTVQERDSGAHVIHIVEYVPPAYDDSLRHSRSAPTATTSSAGRDELVDDPAKPGGVRPLPSTPF
ncbi:hypothetical protein Q8F55_006222 [Vanrija albida]|uniref:Uncharacterized protein n=1 Tax=Vanrija albida TaxID=181172 RepID=A0ABR3PWM0_9TREE